LLNGITTVQECDATKMPKEQKDDNIKIYLYKYASNRTISKRVGTGRMEQKTPDHQRPM
jgi:hypothetical protein